MSLSLNYLFVGLHDVFLNDLHVLVGPDQLGALLGGVLLKLTSNLVNVVHQRLGYIKHLLSLSYYLRVKVDFSLYSDCIFVNLRLSLALLNIIINAGV